jgi:hypothetical protein
LRRSRVVKKLSSFWSCSTVARRDEARPTQARSMSLIVVMALADDITVRRGPAEDSAQGVAVPTTANQSPELQRESGGCHPACCCWISPFLHLSAAIAQPAGQVMRIPQRNNTLGACAFLADNGTLETSITVRVAGTRACSPGCPPPFLLGSDSQNLQWTRCPVATTVPWSRGAPVEFSARSEAPEFHHNGPNYRAADIGPSSHCEASSCLGSTSDLRPRYTAMP